MFYLDPSAWMKRYHRENGTAWVQQLWQRDPPMVCCNLGLVEATAAIVRRYAGQGTPEGNLRRALSAMRTDFARFTCIDITRNVIAEAAGLAERHRLRAADAIRPAAAMSARGLGDVIVVSSDSELLRAAQAEGFATLDPQADPRLPTPAA